MKSTHNGFVMAFFLSAFLLVLAACGGGANTPPVSPTTYTISGQVQNIPSGSAFVLQNNVGNNIIIPAGSTSFSFPTGMVTGGSYNVSVFTQPVSPVQNCTISNGAGTISTFDITNVIVSCSWPVTGSLANARYQHTATLLANGKVLVVGGSIDGFTYLSSAELYDPATGLWTPTSSLTTARSGHTATLLPNGKVLVAGGASSNNGNALLASAELYDPATGLWAATGALANTRYGHTATLLTNGIVLVVGGVTGNNPYLASAELFNPSTGLWTPTGSLTKGRNQHTATLLSSNKVLVVGGGSTGGSNGIASAELFDPVTGLWTPTGSLAIARFVFTATLLPNGKVLVAGGSNGMLLSSAELYDPLTGMWASTASLTNARLYHTAVLLADGRVLVAGGSTGSAGMVDSELYNPSTGLWTQTASLVNARLGHATTLLPDGKILASGGANIVAGQIVTDSAIAELYY